MLFTRYHHYWRDADTVWHHVELPMIAGDRPKLFLNKEDNAYLVYNDSWSQGVFHAKGSLAIAAATADAKWKDWKVVHTEQGPFVNEMLGDVYRWKSEGVLSIMVQQSPNEVYQPTPLRVLDFHFQR